MTKVLPTGGSDSEPTRSQRSRANDEGEWTETAQRKINIVFHETGEGGDGGGGHRGRGGGRER